MKYHIQFLINEVPPIEFEVSIDRRLNKKPSFRDLEGEVKQLLCSDKAPWIKRFYFYPDLNHYSIRFELENSPEFPHTDGTPLTYTAFMISNDGISIPKIVPVMLNDAQHYFIFPEKKHLGDYVPIPTGSDVKFCSYYRARADDIEFEPSKGRLSTQAPRLYLQLSVEKVTFDGIKREKCSCNIYYNFKRQYGTKRVTEKRLQNFRTSLKNKEIWFWYEPGVAHPLSNDSEAVESWLGACESNTSTDRRIEEPQVRRSDTAAIVTSSALPPGLSSNGPLNSELRSITLTDMVAPTGGCGISCEKNATNQVSDSLLLKNLHLE